jgi:hypothetical protein
VHKGYHAATVLLKQEASLSIWFHADPICNFSSDKVPKSRMAYLKFVAMSEISETWYLIDTKRDDFKVGHLFENGQIFELISP